MTVYPGDPEVKIQTIGSYEARGYVLQKISFGNHTGTHLDVPLHMIKNGKSLDDFSIDYFNGQAVKFVRKISKPLFKKYAAGVVILDEMYLSDSDITLISKSQTKLLGLGETCSVDVGQVKKLLENNIVVVNDLVNLSVLPQEFYFSAFPLPIQDGDGSPVRAVAYVD